MKVLEIKNNLVKISYEASDNLALANFVVIEDLNSPYVAQVMNIKAENSGNYAIVKLLFTFNEEGILKNYNGTIPSINASISKLPSKELLDVIPAEKPLFLGNIAQQGTELNVDMSILKNNLLICSDNFKNTENLLINIVNQLNNHSVIIDTEGEFDYQEKYVIGKDFKLPLNEDAINFIYENDLDDVEPINKAIIQDILIEVQKYIKTLPEKFIPFDTFINVIDGQYKETNISELILLKNKLIKYKEDNVFAQDLKEVLSLNMAIEKNSISILDISDISKNLQKLVFSNIYKVLHSINEEIFSFVKINNDNISKKLLKLFIEKNDVYTTIICPHEFKYIQEVKEVSQNIIFFTPLTISHDFASYNTFLNKLNNDEFIIYGAHTQNIPLIVEIASKEIQTNGNFEEETSEQIPVIEKEINDNELEQELVSESFEEAKEDEIIDENIEDNNSQEIEIVEEEQADNNFIEISEKTSDEVISEEINETQEEQPEEAQDIIVEPIVEELTNEEASGYTEEELVEQVAKDVDKAFYEKLPEEDADFPEEKTPGTIEENIKEEDLPNSEEDDLTEEDLNIIDELSTDDIELAGDTDSTENETTPVVPIYPADDIEINDTVTFETGDKVSTAKYGEGIVEKMVKYGNKMLCSIDFPSIGRRLLDPAVTEITKID